MPNFFSFIISKRIIKFLFFLSVFLLFFYIILWLLKLIFSFDYSFFLPFIFFIKVKFLYLFSGSTIQKQILLPFFIGMIGSLSTMLISFIKGKTELNFHIFKDSKHKYFEWFLLISFTMFLGGVAGVGAVNILNSDGKTTEVIVLSLVAGLSGISYLKGIALVDMTEENDILKLGDTKKEISEVKNEVLLLKNLKNRVKSNR